MTGPDGSGAAHRIVALVPFATEIVAALGFADRLVGRSHECDFPPSVRALPACSAPRFDVDGTSREIDARVRAVLQEGSGVYSIDVDLLRRLAPTLIVTQSQCAVCAVSLHDVENAVGAGMPGETTVVGLSASCLADVWDDVRRTAAALGVPERGETLVAGLQARLDQIASRAADCAFRPTVACLEWFDPLMTAGNWVPELVEIAGGTDPFGAAGRHSAWTTWDDLAAHDPDVVVLTPCGFDIPRALAELPVLAARPEWAGLRAVRAGRVFVADGNAYFNRPGPRLVESAEILAEVLHPDRFDFGHAGTGWIRAPLAPAATDATGAAAG